MNGWDILCPRGRGWGCFARLLRSLLLNIVSQDTTVQIQRVESLLPSKCPEINTSNRTYGLILWKINFQTRYKMWNVLLPLISFWLLMSTSYYSPQYLGFLIHLWSNTSTILVSSSALGKTSYNSKLKFLTLSVLNIIQYCYNRITAFLEWVICNFGSLSGGRCLLQDFISTCTTNSRRKTETNNSMKIKTLTSEQKR